MSSYIPVIGLEIHAELLTKSKVFCTCSAEFGGSPNSRCCPVCTGMPGTLPVINQTAVQYAVKAGFALGCNINKFSVFDRKNYFYPDLPKAYQISQLQRPLCIDGLVEIETEKGKESYTSAYFDELDLEPLLDYSWNNTKNVRKIDIDLTCEEYGFKGRGCIGILVRNGLPVEEVEILSKDVEIDGQVYTLSSNMKYEYNCITETSTSITVDADGDIDTDTSWSERYKSKASLSIHGIEVPYSLFRDYSNRMSQAILKIPLPFSFRLDIGVNSDLNLNSARDQIIYDEKWLTFEENLYCIICRKLKECLSTSEWKCLNEVIQKNNAGMFSKIADRFN